MLTVQSFFDITSLPNPDLFEPTAYAWQPLVDLKDYMDTFDYPQYEGISIQRHTPLSDHIIIHEGRAISSKNLKIVFAGTTKGALRVLKEGQLLAGASVIMAGSVLWGDKIALGKGVLVETGAMIKSPTIIGDMTEVRHGAYIRSYCLTGKRCILGHTTEIKHSILLDDAKAGHFVYLGDSILGSNSNIGAGTKFANLKFLPGNVTIFHQGKYFDTNRRKLGAILGDHSQTGCNSVTSPGTLMAKGVVLMPNTTARGQYYASGEVIR